MVPGLAKFFEKKWGPLSAGAARGVWQTDAFRLLLGWESIRGGCSCGTVVVACSNIYAALIRGSVVISSRMGAAVRSGARLGSLDADFRLD